MKKLLLSTILFSIFACNLFVGARFSRPVSASETTFYLGSLEKTYDDAGNLKETKTYISVGSATVVKTQTGSTPPNTEYLYSDHLGSTVLTTNSNGVKNTALQYYPFGNEYLTNPQPATRNPSTDKLYTGQKKDFSSDLYFYNARYYNPQTGNFISADKAEGPNRYSYVQNNPIMRNDPSGLMQIADGGGGGGKSTKNNLSLTKINSPLPGISASGVSNNTLNIAQPGQSYCELNPGKCVADPQAFWNIMGGAVGVGLLPLALVADPVYEVLDMGLCMATSDPATCAMTAIILGPAYRSPQAEVPKTPNNFDPRYGAYIANKEGLTEAEIAYRMIADPSGTTTVYHGSPAQNFNNIITTGVENRGVGFVDTTFSDSFNTPYQHATGRGAYRNPYLDYKQGIVGDIYEIAAPNKFLGPPMLSNITGEVRYGYSFTSQGIMLPSTIQNVYRYNPDGTIIGMANKKTNWEFRVPE